MIPKELKRLGYKAASEALLKSEEVVDAGEEAGAQKEREAFLNWLDGFDEAKISRLVHSLGLDWVQCYGIERAFDYIHRAIATGQHWEKGE